MAKKRWYRFPLYLAMRSLAALICSLPRPIMLWIAEKGGEVAFWLVARQRNKAVQNLSKIYTDRDSRWIQTTAKKMFGHLALTAGEVLQFPKLSKEEVARWVDIGDAFEIYDSVLKEGKGLISITAHFGNWELLAGIFGLQGYRGAVLARKIYYEPYNDWIVGLRRFVGVETIYRDDSSREILKRLARNEIVGLLPDQDMESLKGEFVQFFNRPAYTPVAPARLSLASGAPILANFLVRISRQRYKIVIGKVIRPNLSIERDRAVTECTQAWMSEFEKMIRAYPEQWGWMHDRWKTQPASPVSKEPERIIA